MVNLVRWCQRGVDPRIGFSRLRKKGYEFETLDRGRKTGIYVVLTKGWIPWERYGFQTVLVADILRDFREV